MGGCVRPLGDEAFTFKLNNRLSNHRQTGPKLGGQLAFYNLLAFPKRAIENGFTNFLGDSTPQRQCAAAQSFKNHSHNIIRSFSKNLTTWSFNP